MKALLQRVTGASVSVAGEEVGRINQGLVVFVGVANGDTERDVEYLAQKIAGLRIFSDEEGRFNLSANARYNIDRPKQCPLFLSNTSLRKP